MKTFIFKYVLRHKSYYFSSNLVLTTDFTIRNYQTKHVGEFSSSLSIQIFCYRHLVAMASKMWKSEHNPSLFVVLLITNWSISLRVSMCFTDTCVILITVFKAKTANRANYFSIEYPLSHVYLCFFILFFKSVPPILEGKPTVNLSIVPYPVFSLISHDQLTFLCRPASCFPFSLR